MIFIKNMEGVEWMRAVVVLIFVFCVSNVRGNASLEQRVYTLEVRANSVEIRVNTDTTLTRSSLTALQQDVHSLNTSLVRLEEQVCPKNRNVENGRKVQINPALIAQNNDFSHASKRVLLTGLADEKKWLRDKIKEFGNGMRESESLLKSEIDTYKTNVDAKLVDEKKWLRDKMEVLENNSRENESVIKSEINSTKTLIDSLLQARASEVDNKLVEYKNNVRDKLKSVDDVTSQLNDLDKRFNIIEGLIEKLVYAHKCDNGWTRFESFCYLYVADEKTYASAQKACSVRGSTVADIGSRTENDFVFQLCESSGHEWLYDKKNNVWIGLTDNNTEDVWVSDRTGKEELFTNIRSGQPDGGTDQNCMIMGYKSPYDKWNDWPCSYNSSFVCKKSKM